MKNSAVTGRNLLHSQENEMNQTPPQTKPYILSVNI